MQSNVTVTKATLGDVQGIAEVQYVTWLATYPNKEAGITIEDIETDLKTDIRPKV